MGWEAEFFLEKDNGMELGSWEFEVCGTVSRKTAGVRFFVLKTASFMCGIHPHAFLLSVQCSAECNKAFQAVLD